MHHKYADTDADPHNAKRGFIFAHIGWLLITGHPEYLKQLSTVDISDLTADPILQFQKRFVKRFLHVFKSFIFEVMFI